MYFTIILSFVIGIIAFQFRGTGRLLAILSGIGVIALLASLESQPVPAFVSFIFGGLIGRFTYLVGANISRYTQFGKISLYRIIFYILVIVLLLRVIIKGV